MITIVLPLTREWIEISLRILSCKRFIVLPLTREWIEIARCFLKPEHLPVLPLTREWIEIIMLAENIQRADRSPSHEGVD